MNMIAAAVLVALSVLSLLPIPALAQNDGRAQLRLAIVDEANAPVPNAMVTVFTIYGPRTANADEKGIIVFAGLPAATTQWWARTEHLSGAEATRLKPGENKERVTLHTAKRLMEQKSLESGS